MSKKQKAAAVIASMMMAHFDGPFDDSSFYDELIDGAGTKDEAEGAVYFDAYKNDLQNDAEFRIMVANEVRKNLLSG